MYADMIEEGGNASGNFVFEGDEVEDETEDNAEAGPSTSAAANEGAGEVAGEDGEGEAEEGGDEPEDDYNAAWEVLDVARTIYLKKVEEKDEREDKLNLAECYLALGDVSLETGGSAPSHQVREAAKLI